MFNKQTNTHSALYLSSLMFAHVIQAAPITFNTALPVAEDEYLVREQLILNQSGKDTSAANRDRTEKVAATAIGYGINRRWTIFAVLPYRDINLKLDANRVNWSNSGLGDLTIFTRYSAYQENKLGQIFRLAPLHWI